MAQLRRRDSDRASRFGQAVIDKLPEQASANYKGEAARINYHRMRR